MFRTVLWAFLFSVVFCTIVSAETTPVSDWEKKLPSVCWFVAVRGDSIICVGDEITILSRNGNVLSQSSRLEDTKDLTENLPLFYYSKDNSLVLIKDGYTVKKISLNGQNVWEKSFSDSVQGIVFNGFTEDADGNAYFCGTVERKAGLIVKIEHNGNYVWKEDTLFGSFISFEWSRDSLFVISTDRQSPYNSKSLVVYDSKEKFIKQIIDTGCGSLIVINNGRFFILGQKESNLIFKRTFLQSSDIILKRFSSNGRMDTLLSFNFGKWEIPVSLQKCSDGFLMMTKSDETMNMGTSYLNYYITKLDDSLNKIRHLHFGTDTGGLSGNQKHYRFFASDGCGTIVATHNDTLFKFADMTVIQDVPFLNNGKKIAFSNTILKVYDLQGRLILRYRSGMPAAVVKQMKNSGMSSGLKLISSEASPGSKTKIFYLNR